MVAVPTPARRPTVKDVAAAAGVGVMTVSYTFNRPQRVAEATRARVLAAAEQLGYQRPDGTARALRSGRTGQIGVVFGEHLSYAFDDPQAAAFLAGVADVCVAERLGMVLLPTHGDDTDVDRVLGAAVDGYVLWTTTPDDPVLDAVSRSARPASILGGPGAPGVTAVTQDDRAAARAVAAAALAHGRVPAVLAFPLDRRRLPRQVRAGELPDDVPFPVTRQRLAGYRDAVAAAGLDWDATPVAVVSRNRRDEARSAVGALVGALPAGTVPAVLAMSDELALGAVAALAGAGVAAVVTGWDGSDEAIAAGVLTVRNPLREQGRLCARAVLDPDAEVGPVPWGLLG